MAGFLWLFFNNAPKARKGTYLNLILHSHEWNIQARRSPDSEMMIQVTYFGFLKSKLSKSSEAIRLLDGAKLRDLLLSLADRYGDQVETYVFDRVSQDVKGDIVVNVNDVPHRRIQGLETQLNEGDRVDLMPMFAGGG